MEGVLGVAAFIGLLSIPAWSNYLSRRWGHHHEPHAARRLDIPDDEWNVGPVRMSPPEWSGRSLPRARAGARLTNRYSVGQPEQLEEGEAA